MLSKSVIPPLRITFPIDIFHDSVGDPECLAGEAVEKDLSVRFCTAGSLG